MKRIKAGKKWCFVDDADFAELSKYVWHASRGISTWYVRRTDHSTGRPRTIRVHRQIIRAKRGELVDHADGNGLNNMRSILRTRSDAQIGMNTRKANNSYGFKGVSKALYYMKHGIKYGPPKAKPWRAHIRVEGRQRRLGCFSSPEDAARAYDAAALKFYGEFACTNAALGLL